jgi:hypothetical protein
MIDLFAVLAGMLGASSLVLTSIRALIAGLLGMSDSRASAMFAVPGAGPVGGLV